MTHWMNKAGSRTTACGVFVSGDEGTVATGTTDVDDIECSLSSHAFKNPPETRRRPPVHLVSGNASACGMVSLNGARTSTDPAAVTCRRCLGKRARGAYGPRKWTAGKVSVGSLTVLVSATHVRIVAANHRYVTITLDDAKRMPLEDGTPYIKNRWLYAPLRPGDAGLLRAFLAGVTKGPEGRIQGQAER